jgi:hypothetical protein
MAAGELQGLNPAGNALVLDDRQDLFRFPRLVILAVSAIRLPFFTPVTVMPLVKLIFIESVSFFFSFVDRPSVLNFPARR